MLSALNWHDLIYSLFNSYLQFAPFMISLGRLVFKLHSRIPVNFVTGFVVYLYCSHFNIMAIFNSNIWIHVVVFIAIKMDLFVVVQHKKCVHMVKIGFYSLTRNKYHQMHRADCSDNLPLYIIMSYLMSLI